MTGQMHVFVVVWCHACCSLPLRSCQCECFNVRGHRVVQWMARLFELWTMNSCNLWMQYGRAWPHSVLWYMLAGLTCDR
jgi:hypothetical protein